MAKQKQQGSRGTPRRAGKRANKISAYYKYNYPRNKLRRILKHAGIKAARAWAKEHNAESVFLGMVKK